MNINENKRFALLIDADNAQAKAIDAIEEDGWANLGAVGAYIPRVDSSFDSRNYGFDKLGKLIESLDYVEVQQKSIDSGPNIYIRF